MSTITTLWHYTCDHGATGILREGVVRPGADLGVPYPQARFSWFTDLDTPNREALGLSSVPLDCDRTRHRFRADLTDETTRAALILPWTTVRRVFPRDFRDALEGHDGAMPRHWFVAANPVPVTEDPR